MAKLSRGYVQRLRGAGLLIDAPHFAPPRADLFAERPEWVCSPSASSGFSEQMSVTSGTSVCACEAFPNLLRHSSRCPQPLEASEGVARGPLEAPESVKTNSGARPPPRTGAIGLPGGDPQDLRGGASGLRVLGSKIGWELSIAFV